MKSGIVPLSFIHTGETGIICSLLLRDEVRRRMLDFGMIAGTKIKVLGKSPFGEPTCYSVRGSTIALRAEETSKIMVREI